MAILIESEIEMRPINTIKPYVRNPRKNNKTVEMLVKIIPKVGFNVPILIDADGVIVKGHARYFAAIKLGMPEVPCITTHADPEAIKADRITDNKISEFSEWVNEELLHELDMIDFDFDFSELGLDIPNFDDIPEFDDDEDEESALEAEERQRRYMEYIQQQEQLSAAKTEITTEREIERAVERQKETPARAPKYYKVVCEHCGHTMFVREGDANTIEGIYE